MGSVGGGGFFEFAIFSRGARGGFWRGARGLKLGWLGGGDGCEVGFAFGEIHEEVLAGEGRGVFEELGGADVDSVGLLEAGLDGVCEAGGKDFVEDACAGGEVADWEGDFASLEEIAGHPVCGAEIDFVAAAVGEVEDAGVLEETADDGADADVFRQALDAGAEDGEAADDEVDLDAGLRGLIERLNDGGLEQGVHFGDDARGAAGLGVLLLAADEAEEALGHGERGDEQRAVVVDLGVGGEVVEDHVDALGDLRVAGEQAEVCVEACGDGVVVAGAEVAIAAGDTVVVAADEQGELAVGFESDDAVKDLDTGVFHAARPADVGGLVEAGHELDDEGGFLGGRSLSECGEDGRVVAGAVEGLLHGDDGGVLCAVLDEVDDRIVGVVGVVEQDVVEAELVEDVGGLAAECEGPGGEGLELEVGPVDVLVEEHEAGEIDGAVAEEDLVFVELEIDAEAFDDFRVSSGFDFQPNGVSLAAVVELDADGFKQGARFFFFEVEV